MKLSILPQLMKIQTCAKMVGIYDHKKSVLYTEKIAGNIYACMGFIKENDYYIPNTALREDIRDISVQPQKRVLAIFKKNIPQKFYDEIPCYLAKKVDISILNYSDNLKEKFKSVIKAPWGGSTNLEAAFDKLLQICKDGNVSQEDMPDAIVIVSDMQINRCVYGISDERMTFYDAMKRKYSEAGYEMPQVVFWNVNAVSPAFHASKDTAGVSLVSGYSPAIFKNVMENIGTTPLELMLKVLGSERYAGISA